MNGHPRPILVAGATGYVGGRLVPALLERGEHVRALARRPRKLLGRAFADHPRCTVVQGDALDAASLAPALADVEVAYYLVHSLGPDSDFATTDRQAARTFATACRGAGVRRIIYLSGLGRRGSPELSAHLVSRHDTGDELRSAGVPVTELRAAIIVGSGSASYEIVRDLVERLPVMIAPRWLRTRCEPIAIRDVIAYLVGVLDEPRSLGTTLDIGGGEILTYQEMIMGFAAEVGRRPRIIEVPLLTPRLSSWWLHLVTTVDFAIAQPLIEGLRADVVREDRRIREWLPMPLTPYRGAVRLALERAQQPRRWSHWTDAARGRRRPAPPKAVAGRLFSDARSFETALPPAVVFDRLISIGGVQGYGAGVNLLWNLRGALDRLLGGPGLRRGRPRGPLREGDPLDFWRVQHLSAPHRLTLVAEMLTPGTARLDFWIEPMPDGGSRLHQLASLSGTSPWTALYWRALVPVHPTVFAQLGRHVLRGVRPVAASGSDAA